MERIARWERLLLGKHRRRHHSPPQRVVGVSSHYGWRSQLPTQCTSPPNVQPITRQTDHRRLNCPPNPSPILWGRMHVCVFSLVRQGRRCDASCHLLTARHSPLLLSPESSGQCYPFYLHFSSTSDHSSVPFPALTSSSFSQRPARLAVCLNSPWLESYGAYLCRSYCQSVDDKGSTFSRR